MHEKTSALLDNTTEPRPNWQKQHLLMHYACNAEYLSITQKYVCEA